MDRELLPLFFSLDWFKGFAIYRYKPAVSAPLRLLYLIAIIPVIIIPYYKHRAKYSLPIIVGRYYSNNY
jgi:hypothetical protein